MEVITRNQAKEQGLSHYFTGKPCKHGHVDRRTVSYGKCVTCMREKSRTNYQENELLRNAVKAANRVRYTEKREEVLAAVKSYRERNIKKIAVKDKARKAAERVAFKEANGYGLTKHRHANNPQEKIHSSLNGRIRRALQFGNAAKAAKTTALIGCSIAELMARFESLFQQGMTWENHGEWHIDHIRPCASFDLTDPAQQRECFHYTNLQPLWAEDNLRKSDKWDEVPA